MKLATYTAAAILTLLLVAAAYQSAQIGKPRVPSAVVLQGKDSSATWYVGGKRYVVEFEVHVPADPLEQGESQSKP